MHVHCVLVKLHDHTTIDVCRDLMKSMHGRIDDMIDLRVDVNNLDGEYSCDLSLTTTWPDLAAYQRYTTNPVHLEVRAHVLEFMADAMTVDYFLDPLDAPAGELDAPAGDR